VAAWTGWERDLLNALGAPLTAANLSFLSDWGGHEGSVCTFNPLNTTKQWMGSIYCTGPGVQNYSSKAVGLEATVLTLHNGFYPDIVAALMSGNPFTYSDPQAVAAQIVKWGTKPFAVVYLSLAGIQTPGGVAPLPPVIPNYTPQPIAPKAHGGWADLRTAVNRRLPTALARSQALRRAARRRLARRGRIG